MAKISTYPNVSTPTLPDMLIGTEVTDNNATKNFMISDILGLIGSLGVYVPYTGATANVNLGTFTLSSGGGDFFGPVYLDDALLDGAGLPGTVGQLLSSTVTGTQWVSASSFTSTLQQVLNANNTATQNINLTGSVNTDSIVYTVGLVADLASISLFRGDVTLENKLYDGAAFSPGTAGQVLTSTSLLTEWVDASALGIGLQEVLNTNNVADEDISLTGVTNGITFQGASSYISMQGLNSYISQSGDNPIIQQTATVGSTARIIQSGQTSYFEQQGANAFIWQTGASSFIEQQGASSYILQQGANAYIKQTGTTGYMQPAQILDSTAVVGLTGQVLVSLGSGLGIQWQDKNQIGSFYDTTTQTTTIGVARPMKFGNDDIVGLGVSVTVDGSANRTQIEVTTAGYYDIQFSAQLRLGGGPAAEADIWFRKNGSDIANSNTSVTMQANSFSVAAWNYFVQLNPGDVLQIMWTQSSNNLTIPAAAAAAPHPATPSIIVTVNRVR